jgi:hypothetical protein
MSPTSSRSWPSCLGLYLEVLIRVATLPEFARHSSHKANDDFLYSGEALELG